MRMSMALQAFLVASALFLATASKTFAQFGSWTTVTSIPTAQSNVSAAVVNNASGSPIIYQQGGCCPSATVNYAYDPFNDTWSSASGNFVNSFDPNIDAVVGGIVYHIGGVDSGFCTNTNQAYDPATDSWSQLATMPTPRCHLGVAAATSGAAAGLIYAIGGTNTSGNVQYPNVEVYNTTSTSVEIDGITVPAAGWKTMAPMPTPRSDLVAVTGPDGQTIYAIGGSDAANPAGLTTVEAYNTATNSWSPAVTPMPMPTARSAPAAAVLNGLVYVVGGSNSGGVLPTNESYNPSTNTWMTNTPMPTARAGLSLVTVGDTLYAMGGGNSSGNLATNEAFIPVTASTSLSFSSPIYGGFPGIGLSVDPTDNLVYVAINYGGSFVVDGENLATSAALDAVNGSFDAGSTPIHLWATGFEEANVFDVTPSITQIGTFSLGDYIAYYTQVDPMRRNVWVLSIKDTNSVPGRVFEFDADDFSLLHTITSGLADLSLSGPVINGDTGDFFICLYGTNEPSNWISPAGELFNSSEFGCVFEQGFNPVAHRLYASDPSGGDSSGRCGQQLRNRYPVRSLHLFREKLEQYSRIRRGEHNDEPRVLPNQQWNRGKWNRGTCRNLRRRDEYEPWHNCDAYRRSEPVLAVRVGGSRRSDQGLGLCAGRN